MTGFGTDILKTLKRSKDSRDCISAKRRSGATGSEARKECRDIYGSRLGNAGRQLGIVPEKVQPVRANAFDQARSLRQTPSKMGTVNEFAFGGSSGGTDVVKSGFSYWYLLPLLFFVPQVRKFLGLK
jgi:hypothetical protein